MNEQDQTRQKAGESLNRKWIIEGTCSLCGAKFKCEYEDEMTKAFAEMWEICPECWKKFQIVESGGDVRR